MTLDEIMAALASEVGGDSAKAKDIAKQLRDRVPVLSQVLVNYGAGKAKGDSEKRIKDLETERDTAQRERDELQTAFDEHKAKTPDVAAVEAKVTEKYERKLKALGDELGKVKDTARGALSKASLAKLSRTLASKFGIDPEYAKEVLERKYGDRVAVKDDFSTDILQLGESHGYDAADEDAKIDLLAADIAKGVPSRFVLTNADSGAGVGGGGFGGGRGTGYDPVKAGREMAEQQKQQQTQNKLAFT